MSNKKSFKEEVVTDIGPWLNIHGKFEADYGQDDFLVRLETRVELGIPTFTITWGNKDKLMEDLAEVIRKYQI